MQKSAGLVSILMALTACGSDPHGGRSDGAVADAAPAADGSLADGSAVDASPGADAGPVADASPADASPGADAGSVADASAADASLPDAALMPALTATPITLAFGPVVVGSSSSGPLITIQNTGGSTTGVLTVTLAGADPGSFGLAADGCSGQILARSATCTVQARFSPTTAGARTATLMVTANPGGSAATTLTGTGLAPGALAMAPASASYPDTVQAAASAAQSFTLTNTGSGATGLVTLAMSGTSPSAFTIVPAADQCSGHALAAAATCRFDVTFTPTTGGPAAAVVTASASPGGAVAATLAGRGIRNASLSASASQHDFGTTLLAGTSTFTWTISNTGELASGAVTILAAGSNPADFPYTTTCGAALPSGGACTVTIVFTPTALGARSASFTASATPGGAAALSVTGTGAMRLTVVPSGIGTVSSSDGKIVGCTASGGTCSADYGARTTVTLRARTSNGSQAYFQGWSGATSCSGPLRDCVQVVDQSRSIVASFGSYATSGNLMFVTANGTYTPRMGGDETMYDQICNDAASAAGLNDHDAPNGASYIAWISTATPVRGNALARLGPTARGFIRLDGQLVGDDQASMFASSPRILHSPRYDETGSTPFSGEVLTGTLANGATGQNCNNWSASGSGSAAIGFSDGGAPSWTVAAPNGNVCSAPAGFGFHLLCVMKLNTAAMAPPMAPPGAKHIVVSSSAFQVGTGTPSAICAADVGPTYQALIATSQTPASTLLDAATTYIRPDGTVLGTGAELAGNGWRSGVWQTHDGAYLTDGNIAVWTGSDQPGLMGTVDTSCTDWSDRATPGVNEQIGAASREGRASWFSATTNCTSSSFRVYCVEP